MSRPSRGSKRQASSYHVKRALSIGNLYAEIQHCEPAELSQRLSLYADTLEQMGLPEPVAACYLQVQTLQTVAQLMQDSGNTDDSLLEELECPRFDLLREGFSRCCEWAYERLKGAMDYRSLYNGRTGNAGIARARYYLDRHFSDPDLMLKDVAAEARMSISRFSTLFAREIGCTFTEYVTRLRLQKACELLRDSSLRITQIATEAGYNDPHYFSWIFRKHMNTTPTEYRDQSRKSGKAAE